MWQAYIAAKVHYVETTEGQRSRSHEAEDRSGGLAVASFSTLLALTAC